MEREQRFSNMPVSVSQRTSTRAGGTGSVLQGHAAVYWNEKDPGTQYELSPGIYERIRKGAFDEAIRVDTVVCLFNHDQNEILGKNKAGTLTLRADAVGLYYECQPPNTNDGEKVLEAVRRGDVSGSSFSFTPRIGGQSWGEETDPATGNRITVRWLTALQVYDVAPVVFPAYPSASVGTSPRATPSRLDDILRGKTIDPRAAYHRTMTKVECRWKEIQLQESNKR